MENIKSEILIAEMILNRQKKKLLNIMEKSSSDFQDFASEKDFLHLIEEEAKYKIKELSIPQKSKKYYLNKISELYGEYSEDQPEINEKYYDDFYLKIQ